MNNNPVIQAAPSPDPESNFKVRFAVTRRMGPQATISRPEPGRQYKGRVLLANDDFLVQQTGPSSAVAHFRKRLGELPLDDDDVKRPSKLHGSPLVVKYDELGQGVVEHDFNALQADAERFDQVEKDLAHSVGTHLVGSRSGDSGKADPLQALMGDARLRLEATSGNRKTPTPVSSPVRQRDL